MRPTATAFFAVLISSTLVGCLKPAAPSVGGTDTPLTGLADWAMRALPNEPDHLHNRSDMHRNLSSANFELLGWDPLARQGSDTMGGGGCGAVNSGQGRKLAVITAAWGNAQGLAVADVTDPAKPQKVGEIISNQFWFRDAEITP